MVESDRIVADVKSGFVGSFRCADLGNGDLNGRDSVDAALSRRRRFACGLGV